PRLKPPRAVAPSAVMTLLTGSCGTQGRSRQPPPQQGWRNQRQARKHPHSHVAEDLRTEFRCRLRRNRKAERGLGKLNETSLSQLRRDHETGHLHRKIVEASK